MYNGLWAYDGWALVTNVTEEMANLDRNLFLSIVTGIPFVICCYMLINMSLLSALTISEISSSKAVAVTFIQKCLGPKVFVYLFSHECYTSQFRLMLGILDF